MPTKDVISTGRKWIKEEPHESEAALISTVLHPSNLELFLPSNPLSEPIAACEMPIGMGVVDILVGAANPARLATRIQSNHRLPREIKGVEAVVLSYLHFRKGLTDKAIAERTGLDSRTAIRALEQLIEWNMCTQPTASTYRRTSASEHFSFLVSIEGKLANWKRALEQASRNRLFAAYSYVVMDAKHARPALENMARFREHGVGLAIARAQSRTVHIMCKPPHRCKPISGVYAVRAKEALTAQVADRNVILTERLQNALSAKH